MANIRGLNDNPSNDRLVTSVSMGDGSITCLEYFFPYFDRKSPILFLSVLQFVIYVVTVSLDSYMLRPSSAILNTFGALTLDGVLRLELWRPLTALFLHGSLMHLAMNVLFQLRMAFPLEFKYGKVKVLVVYLVSGVLGDTLAFLIMWAMSAHEMAVGASTAIFGLVGFTIGEMFLDWEHIVHKDQAIFNVA
ncbi:MAG: hypothetical protein KVP17_001014 [Porospora cf. gigantea B]|uniref:uncharacterized protein n=1 Tax=Porospora cf. gigantea B TaxID=2853592 RepID=UPI00357199BE|nr:MAG: hypothetical protein KVP17_001014 [Porospora cf. gigantea B]